MNCMAMVGSLIFWKRNGYHIFRRADGVTDVKLADTGDGNDGTDACFLYFTLFRPSNSYSLVDLGLDDLVGVVVVTDDHILIHTDGTVVYLTDTDTSDIFIIIDGTDQYLGSCLGVTFGSGNVVDDGLEQRLHISTHRRHPGSNTLPEAYTKGQSNWESSASSSKNSSSTSSTTSSGLASGRSILLIHTITEALIPEPTEYEFGLGHSTSESIYTRITPLPSSGHVLLRRRSLRDPGCR